MLEERRKGRFLTGARASYLIILSASAAFVLVSGGIIPYALFYLCLFAPVLSLLHALVLFLQVKCDHSMSTMNITKGQAVDYQFSAYNRGPLASPLMRFDFYDSHGFSLTGKHADISLLPWQKSGGSVGLTFGYRGVYVLGIDQIQVTDMFSLVRLKKRLRCGIRVVVFPRIIHLSDFRLSQFSELQGGKHYRKSSDEALKDTRKYVYGDPMSRIHWNLTAQKSDLITKLFESESDLDVVFFLDLAPINVENTLLFEDFMIEFCVAVVYFMLHRSRSVRLVYAAGDQITVLDGDGPKDFDAFYSALSEAEFTSRVDMPELSRAAGDSSYSLALTAKDPDSALLDGLAGAGSVDYYRLVTEDAGQRGQYDNSGSVRVYDLLPEDDIRALLEAGP